MLPRSLLPLLLAGCVELPATTGTERTERLVSAVLDDTLLLRIRLPPGHGDDPDRRYPVVVQLDPTFGGLQEMAITTGLLSEGEAAGTLPETVVVGIDYADANQRFRDLQPPEEVDGAYASTGVDAFYAALEQEVIPHVDATLPVDPERRVLVGHSLGGMFGLYAAFRHAPPAPPLFAGIVSNDPFTPAALLAWEDLHAARSDSLPLRLYRANAAENGPLQQIAVDWVTARLEDRDYAGLVMQTETFPTDHGGILVPGTAAGLDFVLGGAL